MTGSGLKAKLWHCWVASSASLRIPGVRKVGARAFTSSHRNHGNLSQARGVYERDNSLLEVQNLVCKISRNPKGLRMMERSRCPRGGTEAPPSRVSLGQLSIGLHFQSISHRMNVLGWSPPLVLSDGKGILSILWRDYRAFEAPVSGGKAGDQP